ncbi:hypothetical protein BDN70DRAFT_991745 [Pholiota conissans]|uniref:Uncharacterized protein n=1 Tax=Pholiota conissans TaxID=109636 RepID=A0A9P6CW91_9AGAR|nr:hypothetical protein BDN70DRAFT_991745 [Pholiota conissans]
MAATTSERSGSAGRARATSNGPNKAGPSDRRSDAELGFAHPPPVDHQQRSSQPQTVQIPGLTSSQIPFPGYSRNFGQTAPASAEERARGGARRLSPKSSVSLPFDINDSAERGTKDILRRSRTESPETYRRSILNKVPEEMETSAIPPVQPRNLDASVESRRSYGSIGNPLSRFIIDDGGARYVDGNLSYEEDSELSEEEEEWLLDEELAKQGLYRGNYKNLLLLYTLVPISALMAFVSLTLLPIFAFPSRHASPFPYPPYLPYPLPEVLTATGLWSLSYLFRDSLYAVALFLTNIIPFPTHRFPKFIPILTSVVSAFLQSASTLLLRLLSIPILLIPYYSTEHLGLLQLTTAQKHHFPTWQDDAFRRVWWTALGWAAVEAIVGIKQGYESIGLYKDVLVSVTKTTTKAGFISETTNRRGGAATQQSNQTERTPPPGVNDVNITPTQRTWDARPHPLSHHGSGDLLTLQQARLTKSGSASSSDSILRQYPSDGLQSSGILGETQPLLAVDAPLNPLTRHMTNDSERILAENEVERDLEELIALKNREDLEEIYGIPVICIPVFLSCLHRINSILFSIGASLLLSAAYMRSSFAYTSPPPSLFGLKLPNSVAPSHLFQPSNKTLIITLPVLLVVQALLTLMHTPWIMPRFGIHTVVYIGLLVSLGLFFGGLGLWEALT